VLQFVAVSFSLKSPHAAIGTTAHYMAPQHAATHCNTLQQALQHAATPYNTLQHITAHCNTLAYAATGTTAQRSNSGDSYLADHFPE